MARKDRTPVGEPERRIARLLLQESGQSPPVDVADLLRAKAIVEHDWLPGTWDAIMIRVPKAKPRGIMRRDASPNRERFTMAHEIGHYVLHRDLIREDVVDDAMYRSALSDEYERQADRFAGQVLLPAQTVRETYKRTKALSILAQLFDVSDAALRIRLSELGLGA